MMRILLAFLLLSSFMGEADAMYRHGDVGQDPYGFGKIVLMHSRDHLRREMDEMIVHAGKGFGSNQVVVEPREVLMFEEDFFGGGEDVVIKMPLRDTPSGGVAGNGNDDDNYASSWGSDDDNSDEEK